MGVLHQRVGEHDVRIEDALRSIDAHQVEANTKLDGLGRKMDAMVMAFPHGDFEGHRRYHETMIEMLAERRRLRQAIQEKTISGLIWAALVGLGIAVWHELLALLGRP